MLTCWSVPDLIDRYNTMPSSVHLCSHNWTIYCRGFQKGTEGYRMLESIPQDSVAFQMTLIYMCDAKRKKERGDEI